MALHGDTANPYRNDGRYLRWPISMSSFSPGVSDFAHDLRRSRRGSLLPEPSGERSISRARIAHSSSSSVEDKVWYVS